MARSEYVKIRLSSTEKASVQREADAAGLTISDFVRRTLQFSYRVRVQGFKDERPADPTPYAEG